MGKRLLISLILGILFTGIAYAQVPPPPGPICSLQVVFHVLHNNGPENISDAQIQDAIRILNEDFGKTNADTIDIIPQFKQIAADSRIRFHLATVDPQGNATTGIERIITNLTYATANSDSSKINQWPPNRYVNIWVVAQAASNLATYAYYPDEVDSLGSQVDGIVILHDYVGGVGTSQPLHSRALTHVLGHYFGISSTAGRHNNGTTCGDDSIADTPVSKGSFNIFLCSDSNNAKICHPVGQDSVGDPGIIENYQNFMDFSYCSNMFTLGQCQWMHNTLLSTVANRNQLCGAIGVGIEEQLAITNEVALYPNPTSGNVQLTYQLAKESTVKIEVMDAFGRSINTLTDSKQQAANFSLTIDTRSMQQGVYIVRLTADGAAVSKRLVVVK